MKTLVIHPDDRTTDFLRIIYEGKGYDVVTKRFIPASDFIKMIRPYDRIMMMGHGCPYGLLGMTMTMMNPHVIKRLKQKQTVCIWCNADQYVLREGLVGFYTGMFISEVGEARYFGITVDQEAIDHSNNLFVTLMRDIVEGENVLTEIKTSYVGDCPVIKFNNDRLYYRDGFEDDPYTRNDGETQEEADARMTEPTKEEIETFKKNWGQSHSEATSNLGYPRSHAESDELLMEDFFWVEKDKKWYNKESSLFTERDQVIADYLRNNS